MYDINAWFKFTPVQALNRIECKTTIDNRFIRERLFDKQLA